MTKCVTYSVESVPKMYVSVVSIIVLAIYEITYVQPTNSIQMVERISLYFKLELVTFRTCLIFRACVSESVDMTYSLWYSQIMGYIMV